MDSSGLQKKYMDAYNKLAEAYAKSGIQETVDLINQAILDSDNEKIRKCLFHIQEWNLKVMDLEDMRESLNTKFRHLHLPSVSMFTVLFDEILNQWRFNTEPIDFT